MLWVTLNVQVGAMSFFSNLLVGFAKEHPPELKETSPIPTEEMDATAQATKRATYNAAVPVYSGLCFPLQFDYRDQSGKQRFRLATLRGMRKTPHGLMLSCDCSLYGNRRIFSAEQVEGITTGRNGEPVPNLEALAKKLRVFADGAYELLLSELHVMVFLAHVDGKLCDAERKVLEQFIECRAEKPEDLAPLVHYAIECFVTMPAFEEAVDMLDKQPKEEIEATISAARALIEADGELTPDEAELFEQLNSISASAA